jgi:hypothetical protein
MTLIRKLALALSLALLSASYSNSQSLDPVTGLALSSTGNILNLGGGLPWNGTVTGSAGGYSGGPGPAYNPNTGNIIFSYGLNTASQSVAINTALANAGTGIQLSGYKYSWQIHNDLNNYASNRGTITGNVSLYGYTGNVLESFNYDYNKNIPSFTTFSGTQYFNSRYDPSAASKLIVSFTGKDQNFWAGYYGPRVHVDNLSLLYTVKPVAVVVDPCISEPLSSPLCPGYALATVKNSILNSTVANTIAPITAPAEAEPALAQPALALANPDPAQPQQSPNNSPGSEPPPGSAPSNQAVPQPAASNSNNTPANQPPPQSSGGSQPKAGEVRTAGDNKAGPSLGNVMSMISSNQVRIGNEAKSVVQTAESAAVKDAQQAQQQAENVAGSLTTQSITSSMAQSNTGTNLTSSTNSQSQTSIVNVASISQTSVVNIGGLRSATQNTFADPGMSLSSSMIQSQFDVYSLQAPTNNNKQPTIEVPQNEGIKIGTRSALNDVMEQQPIQQSNNLQEQKKTESVNRNVQPNELAGGVDMARMATQPAGYQAYSFALADAPFYSPKEIYKNQVNVDNARVLRQLSSDRLHQDLINLQYKLGQ